MMELGNIMFGNSRGSFSIPRGCGWEEELDRLFGKIDSDYLRDVTFNNDMFEVFPYYWGDCTCGYEEKQYAWEEENNHQKDCYSHKYKDCKKKDGYSTDYEKLKILYKSYGWETESKNWYHGCAVRCSCDYNGKWWRFIEENDHKEDCPIIKPNFLYKPESIEIQWYKYPLRDSYINTDIKLKDFSVIIDNCINSLK